MESTRHELCAAIRKATAAEAAEAEATAAGAERFEQASKELACTKDRVAELEGEEEGRAMSLKKLEEQVKCMKEVCMLCLCDCVLLHVWRLLFVGMLCVRLPKCLVR